MTRTLREVAHVRTGDKGTRITVSVSAYDPKDFPLISAALDSEAVAVALAPRVSKVLSRFELPLVETLLFVCDREDGDSVTTSNYLDTHGKTLGSLLLGLTVD
jgi:hypothetical protein